MLLSAVLLFFIDDLIANQMSRSYVSSTLDCFCLEFVAIGYIIADDLLCIQLVHIDISFAFYIPVNCTACYCLMAHHISVNRAVRYNVSVNLYLEILRSVIAIVGKNDLYWRRIW